MLTVHLIAAARPNFMKIAPLYHALSSEDWCQPILVHTGQHYDPNMSDAFFDDLNLPAPDHHLGVGSGTHAEQTGGVMIAYEKICMTERPDWIVVAGDVNSTIACALVGAKLLIPVAHLEAGLRSRDREMPEEINRILTDSISSLLWTPSRDGDANLLAEGVDRQKIDFVGNIMLDSYELMRSRIAAAGTAERIGVASNDYGVVTLHRPSNVDHKEVLATLLQQLVEISKTLPLVFAVHPRTRNAIEKHALDAVLHRAEGITCIDPLGYIEFMNLVEGARLALTDSGGLQEETTYLGIPCLTLRESTERPVTVTEGTNKLVKPADVGAVVRETLDNRSVERSVPELWDGNTASRVVASLKRHAL